MKRPKGFAKNYFSLSAICAYSSASILHSLSTSFVHSSRNFSFETSDELEEELDEIEVLEVTPLFIKSTACHCNCYFKQLLYTLIQLFKYFPQTFFIFNLTRTGISPPALTYTFT